MICDGEHEDPPCIDPQCWRREDKLQVDLKDTATWGLLRQILWNALLDSNVMEINNLVDFVEKHWHGATPLESLITAQLQLIRQLRQKVAEQRAALKSYAALHAVDGKIGEARRLSELVWFVSRGATGAGQFPRTKCTIEEDCRLQNQAREEFDEFWSDPHAYYKKLEET